MYLSCISQESLLNFVIKFSSFIMTFSMSSFYFSWKKKIASWPISYTTKISMAKMLIDKVSRTRWVCLTVYLTGAGEHLQGIGVVMSRLHSMFEVEGRHDLVWAKRRVRLFEPRGTLIMPCTGPFRSLPTSVTPP